MNTSKKVSIVDDAEFTDQIDLQKARSSKEPSPEHYYTNKRTSYIYSGSPKNKTCAKNKRLSTKNQKLCKR